MGLTKIVVKGWLLTFCVLAFGLAGIADAQEGANHKSPKFTLTAAPKSTSLGLKSTPATPEQNKKFTDRIHRNDGAFVENKGQWRGDGRYLARSQNLRVWLTEKGWLLDYFKQAKQGKQVGSTGQVVSMEFVGGNVNPVMVPEAPNGSTRDYMGPVEKGKIASVKAYGQVTSKEVYKGVDVSSYMDHGQTRFDFIVQPGADPSQARMRFAGSNGISVNDKRELVAKTNVGDLNFGGLKAYQYEKGAVVPVAVSFDLLEKDVVGFKLGDYDKSKRLTIDPVVYGSYYGGDDGWDEVHGVATDQNGGVYVTGYTQSPSFPKIVGPYGFRLMSNRDAFMTKFQGDVYSHDYAAYYGGNDDDSGDWLQVDPNGDIWVAGSTKSNDFPGNTNPNINYLSGDSTPGDLANGGTFDLIYTLSNGATTFITLAYNASALDVQNALVAKLGHGGEITVTGSSMPDGSMTITLPHSLPGALSVDSSGTWAEFVAPAGNAVVSSFGTPSPTTYLLRQTAGAVTAGTFVLTASDGGAFNFTTAPLAFNATAAQIQAAFVTAGAPVGSVICDSVGGGVLPANGVAIMFTQNSVTSLDLVNAGSTALTGGTYSGTQIANVGLTYDPSGSVPTSGFFGLQVLGQAVAQNQQVPAIQFNTSGPQLQTILNALGGGVGQTLFVQVIPGPGGVTTLPLATLVVESLNNAASFAASVFVDNSTVHPRANFGMTKPSNRFIMRWKNTGLSSIQSLDPEVGNEKAIVIGSTSDFDIAGFAIRKQLDGSGRVVIDLAGEAPAGITGLGGFSGQDSFLLQYLFDPAAVAPGLTMDPTVSRYIGDDPSVPIAVQGIALDSVGNIYIGGTALFFNGTVDTSVTPIFVTTPNVFANISNAANGRLLRNADWFLRKYNPSGTLLWSGLIGGDFSDFAGGLAMDIDGSVHHVGSCVAVDANGDAYITGIASSFDFPRTRGVFGEVFGNNPLMAVTKVSSDGSQILYSTHLNSSSGNVWMRSSSTGVLISGAEPGGISVDARGNAYVAGNVRPWSEAFAHPPPADLTTSRPTGQSPSTIAVTADATQGAAGITNTPDMATQDGFLNVLNSTGTALVFGTYIGGNLDEEIRQPYVDNFGDCWVVGFTDSVRSYWRQVPNTPNNRIVARGALPAGFITGLAFKSGPDDSLFLDGFKGTVAYGTLDNGLFGPGAPLFIHDVGYGRDGFVVRYRLGLPVVNSVTFDSATLAGGLGSTTTGHINLSGGAPAGGMPVLVTLSSTNAASLSNAAPVGQTVVTIPAGATTGNFSIFTSAVTDLVNVDVKAEFEEDFKIGRLVVAPWLQQFAVTPNSIVGGNSAVAQVRLFQNAPSPGITISLSSDSAFANAGNSVTVPTGQSSVTFNVTTTGVSQSSVATLTASLLGVGISQQLTVTPASLLTVNFNPQHVNGGTSTTGTVTLDGNPGASFTVNLAVVGSPAGYSVNPSSLTFTSSDTSKTFVLNTTYEAANVVRTVSATRPAQGTYTLQTITGSVNVDANDVSLLQVSPSPVNGGQNAAAVVTLAKPVDTGGLAVVLSSSDPSVTIQGPSGFAQSVTVTMPAGSSSSSPIAIKTTASILPLAGLDVTISAHLVGGVTKTAPLHVNPAGLAASGGFTISPLNVGGGNPATGTVSLAFAVPFAVSVDITTDQPTVTTFTTPVVIPANTLSQNFTINTTAVVGSVTANLGASVSGGTSIPATLVISQQQVSSIVLNPSTLASGGNSTATVTLSPAAPAGGTPITMTSTDPRVTLQGDGGTFGQSVVVTARSTTTLNVAVHTTGSADAYNADISATATQTKTATLHLTGLSSTFTGFTIAPASVGGGVNATGTLTLSSPTPVDLIVNVSSNTPAVASAPATVTILANHSSATFQITTSAVSATTPVVFTATLGTSPVVTKTANLTVVAPKLVSIRFVSTKVRGSRIATFILTFNAAMPALVPIQLTNSNSSIINLLPSQTIYTDQGLTTTISARTLRVSRPLGTVVTATYNGVSVSAMLVVMR